MAYCDIEDVRVVNPQRTYNTTSKPTATQVGELITNVAGEIDTILSGRGLTVPITTPAEFVTHLKQVNANGVGALAEAAMFPEALGSPGGSPHGQWLYKVYQSQIALLRTGKLPVEPEPDGGPRSFFEQHPIDEPTEEYGWRDHKFKKNKEF